MGLFDRKKKRDEAAAPTPSVGFLMTRDAYDLLCETGYHRLADNPEVRKAAREIAQQIGRMTIYLMANQEDGDHRIKNALSYKIDIDPSRNMTRQNFIESLVMNMLLYGDGNASAIVHTKKGQLDWMEPIAPSRVQYVQLTKNSYSVVIDGVPFDPEEVLHFVFNPDENFPWIGQGLRVDLRDLVNNLEQAADTEKAFMQSPKPSLIVSVDASTEVFSSKDGRQKITEDYLETNENGKPWIVPGEQIKVDQVRPLSIADIALNDSVKLDRKMVASLFGVTDYALGVGEFKQEEWNAFVNNVVSTIAQNMAQEMTRKLIISERMYLKFSPLSLYNYNLETIGNVYGGLYDRGVVDGNEVRDRLGLDPRDELSELRLLENYIPVTESGNQNKLNGGSADE